MRGCQFLSGTLALTLNEKQYLDAIKILYEMLVLTVEESLCQIEQEIEMLHKLMAYRVGNDSSIVAIQ